MSIDMSQFHQVFFEESFEGLDIMETGLMELDLGAADDEEINTIFRAAHSIKGGSGTFGFTDVANFTHVMETLLDEMRDGSRDVTREAVDLLLVSVDCLREMLTAVQDEDDIDTDRVGDLKAQLDAMLAGENAASAVEESSSTTAAAETAPTEAQPELTVWEIVFTPHPHLFTTGNDPIRLFKELDGLGDMTSIADTSKLPPFDDIDPEESYIFWNLELKSTCSEEQIKEVFEWVDEDCDLSITALRTETASPSEEQAPTVPEAEATAPAVVEKDKVATPTPAVAPAENKPAKAKKRPAKAKSGGENSSIRVGIDKIDQLINMVGELVITQSMLSQVGENFNPEDVEKLRDGLGQLERNTRELQENVMQIRMLPISFSFNRFPRLVRDLASQMGKKIELKLSGENTELDKTVMEKIGDPMVHLVRNSLDHGLEMPDVRVAAGKPETGTVHLNAYHEGGNIVIEINDDGAGLNTEKIRQKAIEKGLVSEEDNLSDDKINELIFAAGFSTADQVSDISGRGVGMDVVRRNIAELGGAIEVKSVKGEGSTFTIRLPLTLAILDGQLIRVGEQVYIIPLISIVESLQVDSLRCNSVAGKAELYKLRDDYIPILRLYETFNIEPDTTDLEKGLLVIAEGEGQKVGIFVDDLLAQQQVVIKSLETNYKKVDGISGATILGDGTVAMILDLAGLVSLARENRLDQSTNSKVQAA